MDKENQRISLSRKRILPNPWTTIADDYKQGQLVEGKVTRIVDYGAFVEIAPGVEGLLHVSQLSRSSVEKVSDVVREGETHLLRIVSLDANKQRIGLSLKAVTSKEQIEWMSSRSDLGGSEPTSETAVAEVEESPNETNETEAPVESTVDTMEAPVENNVEETEAPAESAAEEVEAVTSDETVAESQAEQETEEANDNAEGASE